MLIALVMFRSPIEGNDRLKAVRSVWHTPLIDSDMTATGCPTIRALNGLLPELRGVERAERDYIGLQVLAPPGRHH